jgi:hypothetical protein
VSVALADHDDGLAGSGHPRHVGPPQVGCTAGAGGGCLGCCGRGLERGPDQALCADPTVGFLKEEVAEICGALALGASLLRRLGLGAEASRLEVLFGAVENLLTETQ